LGRLVLSLLCSKLMTAVFAQDAVLEEMADYTGFATYDAGIIVPAQITDDPVGNFVFRAIAESW